MDARPTGGRSYTVLSFACLAPGGPIENRDFSHLSDSVFWGFNVFLIALWLAGSAAVYFIWKGRRGAYRAAIIIGWLYVAVVASDLGRVFPVSPDPTGFALGVIMIADAINRSAQPNLLTTICV